jgi:hypothetical protein
MTDGQIHTYISSGTWGGALMAAAGAFSLADWLAIGGFVCAVSGVLINAIHKYRMRKQQALQDARLFQLKEKELNLKYGGSTNV